MGERDEWVLRIGGPADHGLAFLLYTKGREPTIDDVEMILEWMSVWQRALYPATPTPEVRDEG